MKDIEGMFLCKETSNDDLHIHIGIHLKQNRSGNEILTALQKRHKGIGHTFLFPSTMEKMIDCHTGKGNKAPCLRGMVWIVGSSSSYLPLPKTKTKEEERKRKIFHNFLNQWQVKWQS